MNALSNSLSLPFHVGARVVSAVSMDKNRGYSRIDEIRFLCGQIASFLAARSILITALKVTRFAVTNKALLETSLLLAVGLPLANYAFKVLTKKGYLDNQTNQKLVLIANIVSLVASIAVVVSGAAPLVGWGGIALAVNTACVLSEV